MARGVAARTALALLGACLAAATATAACTNDYGGLRFARPGADGGGDGATRDAGDPPDAAADGAR